MHFEGHRVIGKISMPWIDGPYKEEGKAAFPLLNQL